MLTVQLTFSSGSSGDMSSISLPLSMFISYPETWQMSIMASCSMESITEHVNMWTCEKVDITTSIRGNMWALEHEDML